MKTGQVKRTRRLNKKFRFQLLEEGLTERYRPCKVLDVGGGKGLLALNLIKQGWVATVVDPVKDIYLHKNKDIHTVPRIKRKFKEDLITDFDLIIGLHAHGANLQIINACKKYKKDFLLLPCCVIDEPLVKVADINWFESLVEYATNLGFKVKTDILNFKGQNRFLYTDKKLVKRPILYCITGLPFSGKTTLKNELFKKHNLNLISIDDIMDERKMWRSGHPTQDDWNTAYSLAYEKLDKLLMAGKSVVFDGGSLKFSERETQRLIAKRCEARFKLIYVNTTVQEIKRRRWENKQTQIREDLSDSNMEAAFEMFEEPTKQEKQIIYNCEMGLEEWMKQYID